MQVTHPNLNPVKMVSNLWTGSDRTPRAAKFAQKYLVKHNFLSQKNACGLLTRYMRSGKEFLPNVTISQRTTPKDHLCKTKRDNVLLSSRFERPSLLISSCNLSCNGVAIAG